jgi:hypothetical protein
VLTFILFFFFLVVLGFELRVLPLARQALCCLRHTHKPFVGTVNLLKFVIIIIEEEDKITPSLGNIGA